jgi:hypothetical protein
MVAIKKSRSPRSKASYWIDRILSMAALFAIYHFWWKEEIETTSLDPILPQIYRKQMGCTPHRGLIIVSLLDSLAYNLLQIAFARRMAKELCWEVAFRPLWNVGFGPNEYKCFTNAITKVTPSIQQDLNINDSIWEAIIYSPKNLTMMDTDWDEKNSLIKLWSKELAENERIWPCIHPKCIFSEQQVKLHIDNIRSEQSITRIAYLENYFVHYEWLDQWRPSARTWLSVSPTCCSHPPPPSDTIMIHIHHAKLDTPTDHRTETFELTADAYVSWLLHLQQDQHDRNSNVNNNEHSNNNNNSSSEAVGPSIWIVCQSGCGSRPEVQALMQKPWNAKVVNPRDPMDTVCTLSQASTLLVAPQSMLSSVAATLLVLPDASVHYPTEGGTLDGHIRFSLVMPEWRYHLVANSTFQKWDIPHSSLAFQPSWNF